MYSSLECILDLLLFSTLFVWVLLENYILLIYFILICFRLAGVFFYKGPIQETWTCVYPPTTWLTWLPDHHKGGEVFKIGTALPPCWQIFCFFLCTPSFLCGNLWFCGNLKCKFLVRLGSEQAKMAITNWAFLGLGGYWWWWWWLITVVMMALMMRSIIWLGQGWNCLTCSFYPITESFRGPPSKNWKPSNFRSNQTVYYGNQPRMMG